MACVIAVCEIKDGFAFTFVMFLHGLTPAAHVKIIKICPPPIAPPNSGRRTAHLIRHPLGAAKGEVGQKSSIIYIQQGQRRPNFKSRARPGQFGRRFVEMKREGVLHRSFNVRYLKSTVNSYKP